MLGGPLIVFTTKAVENETLPGHSTNWCKPIVENDASQRYLYSMCQVMPTGLYTRWELDFESRNLKPRQNKRWSFENMVMSYFLRVRPRCKVESFYTTGSQKKSDAYAADGFC